MTGNLLLPLPRTKDEAIAGFTELGLTLKAYMEATEANVDWVGNAVRLLAKAHGDLDRAGYTLEEIFGVPDGTFGAGGTSKGGGGGQGGGGG